MSRWIEKLTRAAKAVRATSHAHAHDEPLDAVRVFGEALSVQARRHAEMKQAAAGLLYVRNKLEVDLLEHRAEESRASTPKFARKSGRQSGAGAGLDSDQDASLRGARPARERARGAPGRGGGGEAAVPRLPEELRSLEREKLRAVATLQGARLRRRLEKLSALDDRAPRPLEAVRSEVARLLSESHLERELRANPFAEADASTELALVRASLGSRGRDAMSCSAPPSLRASTSKLCSRRSA